MTVPELIARLLDNLRRHFYTDAGTGAVRVREFKRDERQLIKAIATYGYECDQRGWPFQAEFIYHDLMRLLLDIRTSEAEIKYLPVYLSGAIRRHLGQRAEELNAQAKALPTHLNHVLAKLARVGRAAPPAPSDVEIFTQVYRGIGKIQRARKPGRARAAQPQLL